MPIIERLRDESRHGTVVVVRVVDPVRVELDLAVVEVEIRGVGEVAVSVWIFATRPSDPPSIELYLPTGSGPICSQP